MPIEVKNFGSAADEAKDMPNARMEAVNVLGQRAMKLTLSPDWKWSNNIKPLIGKDSCQATHTEVIFEGKVHCVCDDGSEATYSAVEAYAISPGHDAWWLVKNRQLCMSLLVYGASNQNYGLIKIIRAQ